MTLPFTPHEDEREDDGSTVSSYVEAQQLSLREQVLQRVISLAAAADKSPEGKRRASYRFLISFVS